MTYVVHFFGTGIAFFVGVGLVALGLAFFAILAADWRKPLGSLFAAVGLLILALSATPLPYALYAVGGAVCVVWLIAERTDHPRARPWLRAIVGGILLVAVGLEVPYWLPPHVPAAGRPTLYVIGDSVSAGLTDSEADRTWPKVLARTHDIEVVNCAVAGATAKSALPQAERLPDSGGLVLLEIGGNDMLGRGLNRLIGGTPAQEFERELDTLLTRVCAPDRMVLMMELPLPPFSNEFGRIQRRLSAKHGVRLIPKHVFCAILSGDGLTIDGIHLTKAGHERMAEVVWETIRGAYGS